MYVYIYIYISAFFSLPMFSKQSLAISRAAAVTKAAELTSQEMGCSRPWLKGMENPGIPKFGIWGISTKILVNQPLWPRLPSLDCCAVIA